MGARFRVLSFGWVLILPCRVRVFSFGCMV